MSSSDDSGGDEITDFEQVVTHPLSDVRLECETFWEGHPCTEGTQRGEIAVSCVTFADVRQWCRLN